MPRLDIRIVSARGLPDVQTFGKIDPFCTVELEHKRFQTTTQDNTQNPQWNEVFKFNVADADSSQLMFSVWNDNKLADDFLGCYPMSISGLNRGEVEEKTVLLQQCKSNAELTIRVMAADFGDIEEPETAYAPPRTKPQGGMPPHIQQLQAQYPPQQQPGYPPQQQPGYPPQQPGYPPQQQPGYPPQQQYQAPPPQQQYQAPPPQQQYQAPPQQYQAPPPAGGPPGFQGEEYISLHADLVAAVAGQPDRHGWAVNHWTQFGHNEGRAYSRSSPPYDFNPEQYIAKHPDLVGAAAGQPDRAGWATNHWMQFGVNEGRRYK